MFNFLRNYLIVFPKCLYHFISHQQYMRESSSFSTSSPTLGIVRLFNYSRYCGYIVVSHFFLIELPVSLFLSCKSSLFSGFKDLVRYLICRCFLPVCALSFYFINDVLKSSKFYKVKFIFFFFFSGSCLLCHI